MKILLVKWQWFISFCQSKTITHKNPMKSEALAEKKLMCWICFG